MPFIIHQNCKLHYNRIGTGKNILLLFHGFGQYHKAFDTLTESLSKTYTLFAFDLFFHGQSTWNQDELPLEKSTWREIMTRFFEENNLERFGVLGFSMGGKFALATLESFPTRIENLILLAPDGIKTSFWYSLATYPLLLRKFFRSMIFHPGRLHKLVFLLRTLRLVDKGVLRFAEHQMNTREKRERVYYSWVVFRHLHFDMKSIATHIQEQSIPLTLIVGKHDKIITATNMRHLLRHLPQHACLVIDSGHNQIIEESIPTVKQVLGL